VPNPLENFSPHPASPQNAEFYRRALDEWPSPILVVDGNAEIVYGNRALIRLGGWDLQTAIGSSVFDYLEPAALDQLSQMFHLLTEHEATPPGQPWASVTLRARASNGQAVPVVATGTEMLDDPEVAGILYDIRPAYEQDILRRGLTSLTQGEPIDAILSLITDMISLPPLAFDAAVLEPQGDGRYRVIGATSERFEAILEQARDPQPWNLESREPQRLLVSQFPGGVGEDLFEAGYREFWYVAPESGAHTQAFRIVAAERSSQSTVFSQNDRLSQATDLAAVVLLRARADALLEHSATHDGLTKLANREGFQRKATEALATSKSETAAMLFLDLDGFKQINDEHGHAAGDRVLETIAERLTLVTRSVDLVARLGGDEFVVLVGAPKERPADRARVQVIAERALEAMRRPIQVGDATVSVAASIGGAIRPMPTTLEPLLAQADAAMYVAKRAEGQAGGYHIHEL